MSNLNSALNPMMIECENSIDTVDHYCYRTVVEFFAANCFNLSRNPYVGKYMSIFVRACQESVEPDIQAIIRILRRTCVNIQVMDVI